MTTDSAQGIKLLNILLGQEASIVEHQNVRELRFLSVREGKKHKDGLVFGHDGKTLEGLFDPWGNPYTVVLNTNNHEKLDFVLGRKNIQLEGATLPLFHPERITNSALRTTSQLGRFRY